MVSSSTSILPELPVMGFGSIISVLKSIFPLRNMRLLDLSYNTFHHMPLAAFLEDCSSLEQITYNTTDKVNTALNSTGTELENCSSLTELHMDNSTFRYYNAGLSNLENEKYSKQFLFWQCRSKVLRDVSIKNATYNTNKSLTGQPLWSPVVTVFPQRPHIPQYGHVITVGASWHCIFVITNNESRKMYEDHESFDTILFPFILVTFI